MHHGTRWRRDCASHHKAATPRGDRRNRLADGRRQHVIEDALVDLEELAALDRVALQQVLVMVEEIETGVALFPPALPRLDLIAVHPLGRGTGRQRRGYPYLVMVVPHATERLVVVRQALYPIYIQLCEHYRRLDRAHTPRLQVRQEPVIQYGDTLFGEEIEQITYGYETLLVE